MEVEPERTLLVLCVFFCTIYMVSRVASHDQRHCTHIEHTLELASAGHDSTPAKRITTLNMSVVILL